MTPCDASTGERDEKSSLISYGNFGYKCIKKSINEKALFKTELFFKIPTSCTQFCSIPLKSLSMKIIYFVPERRKHLTDMCDSTQPMEIRVLKHKCEEA
jgi:hypothetical protein